MEHMQRIADKLNKLREQDTDFEIFGADSHKYKMNPVLTEAKIKAYEEKNNLTLPEDYRWFLMNIGNGGAGPCYGLYKLSNPKYKEDYPFVNGQMFSIIKNEEGVDYTDLKSEEWGLRQCVVQRKSEQGTIKICTEGCGMEIMLVLKGKEKGAIWFTDFGNESGLFSIDSQTSEDLCSMTFAEWYEMWLDDALDGGGFNVSDYLLFDDGLTQIEVTKEDIEEYLALEEKEKK